MSRVIWFHIVRLVAGRHHMFTSIVSGLCNSAKSSTETMRILLWGLQIGANLCTQPTQRPRKSPHPYHEWNCYSSPRRWPFPSQCYFARMLWTCHGQIPIETWVNHIETRVLMVKKQVLLVNHLRTQLLMVNTCKNTSNHHL
jgi:hypothetical protein